MNYTRVVYALGGLFVALGAVQIWRDVASAGPPAEILADAVLFASPAIVLFYGAHWIRQSDLRPDRYPRIAGWCLAGASVMLVVTGLFLVNPDATFADPFRMVSLDLAIGSVAGLGVGVMEARALSRAGEAEDQKRALRESKEELQTLIELLPVAVFVAEADGEIVEWNDAAEEIWGGEIAESDSVAEYDRYEAWWVDSGDPVAPEEWPLARALEGEAVTDPDEIRIKGFDGETRTVLNHGMPIRDADGEVSRAVVTLIDISDLKEYQRRLEESNRRLEQFAHAASHDLQEPLRMVSTYLQLLERRYGEDLDEDAREYLGFAVDGADRMREMVQALLEYSRVDRDTNSFAPVDLDGVLESVLDDLQVRIEERDATVHADPLPRVYGDREQLRQVLQNLLDNAIEYGGEDPPRIEVSAEREGDRWVISVSDDGIGIDADYQDSIFDVFERLHTHDEHDGTGIGLALCERIVERHGGDIWVESDPGEGSTFRFTVPADAPPAGPAADRAGAPGQNAAE